MVAMYSELDPEMLPLYLFSPVTRHPPSPCLPELGREEVYAAREGRSTNDKLHHHLRPSVLWGVRAFLLPFPLCPSLSLSLRPYEAPLSPIPSQTGCACGAEKDPLGPIQLHPHSTPHPGSQMLPPGLALAGGFSFSPTCHPLSSVVHSMTWHVLISFLSLSLLFFFDMQIGLVCTSEDKNYWLTQTKHLHWNNCCLSCLLFFFCIDIFTDCHLDLTVYVCLFYCLKYDSHLVE